ncbi:hypothetical protein VTJ04DRAFT_3759 [Mycothermus thermophilus]|uniref:uncharacterized protein n=1 Tax=Humicola insolens TaxID=85995 RepID=UPI003743EC9B
MNIEKHQSKSQPLLDLAPSNSQRSRSLASSLVTRRPRRFRPRSGPEVVPEFPTNPSFPSLQGKTTPFFWVPSPTNSTPKTKPRSRPKKVRSSPLESPTQFCAHLALLWCPKSTKPPALIQSPLRPAPSLSQRLCAFPQTAAQALVKVDKLMPQAPVNTALPAFPPPSLTRTSPTRQANNSPDTVSCRIRRIRPFLLRPPKHVLYLTTRNQQRLYHTGRTGFRAHYTHLSIPQRSISLAL